MKSRVISRDKGFLISEIMIAFSLMIIFLSSAIILSASAQEFRKVALNKLERLEWISENQASTTIYTQALYGNDTVEYHLDPITKIQSDYESGWGKGTCDPRIDVDINKFRLITSPINLGAGNASTDLEVRNGIAYVTADSSSSSLSDILIIDLRNPATPDLISSLHTGPGVSAIEVAGPYIYAANLGTTHQLQVIDIHDRSAPVVIARLKLPLPRASSTPPFATALFYHKSLVYLGTEKWEGAEFSVIDVSTPSNPIYIGGFETNTQINDIYVRNGIAYVAASDIGQMRVLDVSDPSNINQIAQFSPSGWETQQGKVISYFEKGLSLGRTTGGFNVTQNHELFSFPTSTDLSTSKDIPGGIYGITEQPEYIFTATRLPGDEFQMWKRDLSQKIHSMSLGFLPQKMVCDGTTFYFATGNSAGVGIITTRP
jgi:hypothetical protein